MSRWSPRSAASDAGGSIARASGSLARGIRAASPDATSILTSSTSATRTRAASPRTSSSRTSENSGDRGQTEPIAALVAVLAIAIGLGIYAGVAADQSPGREEADAEATMQQLTAAAVADGVLDPAIALDPKAYRRPGEAVNVTVRYDGRIRSAGPTPPPDADSASRPVTIRTDAGEQVPGRIAVEVWNA